MGQPWVPSAGDLLLPSPAVGQIQDGNVSSSAPKPWAGKTRELRKELELTPSDALTIPGSFAYSCWWKCHHHSRLPFLILLFCVATETFQDKAMKGLKSWWAKSQSSFSDVPVPAWLRKKELCQIGAATETMSLASRAWALNSQRCSQGWTAFGSLLGFPWEVWEWIWFMELICDVSQQPGWGKEWQNNVGNEA